MTRLSPVKATIAIVVTEETEEKKKTGWGRERFAGLCMSPQQLKRMLAKR